MIHHYKANCSKDNLKLIREFVKVVLTDYRLSEKEITRLVLAVDEVCSNLIIHSNECDASKQIEINIENQKSNTIIFKIVDSNSMFFDPQSYEPPTLDKIVEERRRGGLGLNLIKQIMDSIEVKQDVAGKGNIWTLSKHID